MGSGAFVDFAVGENGFKLGHAGRHTAILHSSEYNSVLVKANILDAIEDPDYFARIIQAHSLPGEKAVVFMDVNSTIICNDSVQSKEFVSMFEEYRATISSGVDGNGITKSWFRCFG